MIGWFLTVLGRAPFSYCLIGWLSRAQTLFSWYCVLGYTMPLIAAVQVLVTWGIRGSKDVSPILLYYYVLLL